MLNNISNTTNYKPQFTSEIRIPYSTAIELGQYKRSVQQALFRQFKKLETNGEDNLVYITTRNASIYPYRGSDKLGVQVLKRNNESEIIASPIYESDLVYETLNKKNEVVSKIVDISKLYNTAKEHMKQLAKDNKFSRFI